MGTLKVDGKVVDTKQMPKTLPMILQWDESFDIGSDTLTGVNDADYQPPFPLTAKLNKLTIKVDRPQLSPEDIKKLRGGDAGKGEGRLIPQPTRRLARRARALSADRKTPPQPRGRSPARITEPRSMSSMSQETTSAHKRPVDSRKHCGGVGDGIVALCQGVDLAQCAIAPAD